ncbi:hypothetical protein ACHWQZ_G019030 [Mnemiopsis leidyi]
MIEGVGLLPYSERLQILQLTTLAERRSRGDLIEVYKACQGLSQLAGVFNFSRSGLNLVCKPGSSKSSKVNRIKRNFISERVISSWNKLPIEDLCTSMRYRVDDCLISISTLRDQEEICSSVSDLRRRRCCDENYQITLHRSQLDPRSFRFDVLKDFTNELYSRFDGLTELSQ